MSWKYLVAVAITVLGLVVGVAGTALAQAPNPVADPAAVVVAGNARFTVLTPALIRMEWSPTGQFEDASSMLILNRRMPVPELKTAREEGWLTITTNHLRLRYKEDGGRFDEKNLSITLTSLPKPVTWHPGQADTGNLFGNRMSVDGVAGFVPLKPGLLSRDGWTMVDDSNGPLFLDPANPFPTPRPVKDVIDWYFFGYGHQYQQALTDYARIAGPIPLPPRYSFGSWWSRWWPYSEEQVKDLIKQYNDHDVPLDVLVLDMDWHKEGWSGYSWEPKYFPDPDRFLKWLHETGLRITLNLHPSFPIEKHETHYADLAKALGLDPAKGEPIPYDHAKPEWVATYLKHIIHPLLDQGIDFWWLDVGECGAPSQFEGFNGLLWINAFHFLDGQRAGERGLIYSRWGGLGNHRYQIGFSGDCHSTWETLAFEPYLTATSGNVCFPFWSHDIGGFQPGPVEPEMYARWIQWGVFSPTLRTHSTCAPEAERRIWAFPDEIFQIARKWFHLRYELVPYIYSASRQCYDSATPLCRPLYYEWPEIEDAYAYKAGYLYGDQFYVAPVAAPGHPLSRCTPTRVWIPPGEWVNWFTGQTFSGPAYAQLSVPLAEAPVFVRAGGIITTAPKMRRTNEKPLDPLITHVFPGETGQAELYEDDGHTLGYQKGECARTAISQKTAGAKRTIEIHAAKGTFQGMLKERVHELRLRDTWPAASVTVDGKALPAAPAGSETGWWYDVDTLSVVIRLPRTPVNKDIAVTVESPAASAGDQALRDGLRGRLALLEEVAGLLGDKTPAEIREALKLRPLLPAKVDEAVKLADSIVKNWSSLLSQALEVGVDPAVSEKVGARLLGVSHSMRLEQANKEQVEAKIILDLAAAPPFGGLKDIAGRVRLTFPAGWKLQGEEAKDGRAEWDVSLDEGQPALLTATLIPDGRPTTGAIAAEFLVRCKKHEHRATFDKLLLPGIDKWWVVGPFDNPQDQKLDKAFPPEEGIDLQAQYDGQGGAKVAWKKIERELAPGVDLTADYSINFHKVLGAKHENAVSYALTYLHAPADLDAVLALGSDDGMAVWLNGKEVHRSQPFRVFVPRQDRVPVRLPAGANTLLIKVIQGVNEWDFSAALETPDGKPLPQVEARLTP